MYMSNVGAKLSKLDRFLAFPNFLAAFSSLRVTTHPRELSDHSPITLSVYPQTMDLHLSIYLTHGY